MKDDVIRFLKGFAMGAANVIPGVSGGTIAFLTGIYERLIEALKRIDMASLRLLAGFRWRELSARVDARFLLALAAGVAASILTLAKLLEVGFREFPELVWAFFFGLIAASLPAVGKLVKHWSAGAVMFLLAGTAAASSMALLSPAGENSHPLYLVLCGVVAMASMILPGLSGSFVLLLMGNYRLVMIDSVTALAGLRLGEALPILIPVAVGAVLGLLVLARVLSWLFHHWHDLAVALITGFVAGSLLVIWPWKEPAPACDSAGDILVKTAERQIESRPGSFEEVAASCGIDEEIIIRGFRNWHFPDLTRAASWAALAAMAVGAVLIVLLETASARQKMSEQTAIPAADRDPSNAAPDEETP